MSPMSPSAWGPILWNNFHLMSFTYNGDKRENYTKFFKSIPYILPCYTCSEHFRKLMMTSPPEKNITGRESMIKWLNNSHNTVNKRLHKKIVGLSACKQLYHKNGNLNIDHKKMAEFVKIMQNYLSSGISSIVLYHGRNVIINYCYFCPCLKCRKELTELVDKNGSNENLKTLCNQMIKIIKDCVMLNSIDKVTDVINLRDFVPNQKVVKVMTNDKLKVIIKKDGSTPGVKKKLKLIPNTLYTISAKISCADDVRPFIWIRNIKTGEIIKDYDHIVKYKSDKDGIIELGIFVDNPKYGDIFYLTDVLCENK